MSEPLVERVCCVCGGPAEPENDPERGVINRCSNCGGLFCEKHGFFFGCDPCNEEYDAKVAVYHASRRGG